MDDFALALADYRITFPDLESLGDEAATWLTEYQSVRDTGFSAVLVTNTNVEGTGGGGQRNFDQKTLMKALLARRGELDSDFLATINAPGPRLGQPHGLILGFGC